MLGTIHTNCPKLSVYLDSKTGVIISFNIFSKDFFNVTNSNVISYESISLVWLFPTNWLTLVVLSNPTQLVCNGSLGIVAVCFFFLHTIVVQQFEQINHVDVLPFANLLLFWLWQVLKFSTFIALVIGCGWLHQLLHSLKHY